MGNCCGLYTVETQKVRVIENCGKFDSISDPGCHCLIPCYQAEAGELSMAIWPIREKVTTKTKEGVFLEVAFTVQYKIKAYVAQQGQLPLPETEIKAINDNYIKLAFYSLVDTNMQLKSFCLAFVRGHVPEYSVDDMYTEREELAARMKNALEKEFNVFGFTIHNALITDLDPDQSVKLAMDSINKASRNAKATEEAAEAEKMKMIKEAEALAEAKRLSGVGLASQRKAVVEGLQSSMEYFAKVQGISTKETMMLVLMNQYFDMLKDVSANSRHASIFIPHAPGSVGDMARQIRDSALMSLEDDSATPLPAGRRLQQPM